MLSIEEITLINIYKGNNPDKREIINKLRELIPLFTESEQEMKELVLSTIRKLTAMSNNVFQSIDFGKVIADESIEE